jgi:hypothetical protein
LRLSKIIRTEIEKKPKAGHFLIRHFERNLETKRKELATSENGLSSLSSKVTSLKSQIEGADTK